MRMNGLDERRHMFGRRVLADAMTEVEDMTVPAAVGALRAAETVEHGDRFARHGFGRCEQHRWIEVALQCDPVPDQRTGLRSRAWRYSSCRAARMA